MDSWLQTKGGPGLPGGVNWSPQFDFLTDAGSFESAAAALVVGWQRYTDDSLLKPILYLYRHASELHLKAAIKVANDCVDVPFADIDGWFAQSARHSLLTLRNRLLELMSRPELHCGPLPLGDDTREGRLLAELHELDPKGDELRYPTRWNRQLDAHVATRMPGGADTLGRSVLINVEQMGADLGALNQHLGAIHDWLYEERYRPLTDRW